MIIGIGTDIISVARINKILQKYKNNFINKILSKQEIESYQNKLSNPNIINHFIAKRFSAKESFAKATGFGIGRGLNFKDIIILNDKYGKPYISLNKEKYMLLYKLFNIEISTTTSNLISDIKPNIKIHLTISDEIKYISTFVIIELS